MRTNSVLRTAAMVVLLLIGFSSSQVHAQNNWPQFRGPQASGIGTGNPPIEWDVETGKNVGWKTPIAGLGHSSPVVWDQHVFLTTAINSETDEPTLQTGWMGGTGKAAEEQGEWKWQVVCLDIKDGSVRWSKDVAEGAPEIKRHLKATHANCSVATDGQHVIAFFGSEGLYCFDFDGELLWKKDLGRLHSGPYNADELEWGFASSPVIHDSRVIVQCDCLNTKFLAMLDIENGEELLRIERDDVATWSTPAIVETEERTQIVCNGFKQMAGYDMESGEQLWKLNGGGDVPVPTPLFANDLIYLTNGHGRSPTYAISPDASGDLTPPSDEDKLSAKESSTDESTDESNSTSALPNGLAWWLPKDGSYMPTPIVVGELLYTCNDNGRLAVVDALTGESVYRKRIGEESGTFSASAVATADRLYFSSESGRIIVIKSGETYQPIAENDMKEIVMATPAIAGDQLLIRTAHHLYCLQTKEP